MDTPSSPTCWHQRLEDDWRAILAMALAEDLGPSGDCTTGALVPPEAPGRAAVVTRTPGVIAGLPGVELTLARFDPGLRWSPECDDATWVEPRRPLGIIEGPARAILAAERTLLNFVGKLSGIATLTRQYVEALRGTRATICDTRKTTPGWRRLEKYAVGCGGGENHRMGLYDAILIKDNHLALGTEPGAAGYSPAEAVARARQYVASLPEHGAARPAFVEIEVDTLNQLDAVLAAGPDVVLLDNFSPADLRTAVDRRDAAAPSVFLEASGGVSLGTVRAIAETGVERISAGALTHSAAWLDLGLDWLETAPPRA